MNEIAENNLEISVISSNSGFLKKFSELMARPSISVNRLVPDDIMVKDTFNYADLTIFYQPASRRPERKGVVNEKKNLALLDKEASDSEGLLPLLELALQTGKKVIYAYSGAAPLIDSSFESKPAKLSLVEVRSSNVIMDLLPHVNNSLTGRILI